MRISPKYSTEDWANLKFSTEEEWHIAIGIFNDRISGRFLKPVFRILKEKFAGFAIMAIDCLLIETLQQFREGVDDTPRGKGMEYFKRFLTTTSFRAHFDERMAEIFYNHIRCGILHKAETAESSRIIAQSDMPLVKYTDDGCGIIVNRNKFHDELIKVFEKYITELEDPSNYETRSKFKKKMDYICRASSEIM